MSTLFYHNDKFLHECLYTTDVLKCQKYIGRLLHISTWKLALVKILQFKTVWLVLIVGVNYLNFAWPFNSLEILPSSVWIHPWSLVSFLSEWKCRAIAAIIPGTPATVSNIMMRLLIIKGHKNIRQIKCQYQKNNNVWVWINTNYSCFMVLRFNEQKSTTTTTTTTT